MAAYTQALPAQAAAGVTTTTLIGVVQASVDNEARVTGVTVTSPSLVTGAATNNATINVRYVRAGTPTVFASLTLAAGVNLPAETPVNVPLTAAISPLLNDAFDIQLVQNGTGLALPAGIIAEIVLD